MKDSTENTGLPGSIQRAISEDKKTVKCPVCCGTGIIDSNKSKQVKQAWDAVNEETIRSAVGEIVGQALKRMKKPPPSLHRRYRLTEETLAGIKRVRSLHEAASVIRRISGSEAVNYVLRDIQVADRDMVVDVLFRSQAAVAEGFNLFGTALEEIENEQTENSADEA